LRSGARTCVAGARVVLAMLATDSITRKFVRAASEGATGDTAVGDATVTDYAGFWWRSAAAMIDFVILLLGLGVAASFLAMANHQPVNFLRLGAGSDPNAVRDLYGPTGLVGLLAFFVLMSWAYFAFSECSSAQATVGKRLMGLYVTDASGERVSLLRASSRFAAGRLMLHVPLVGVIYFLGDCVCAEFTKKKQAVHDMISGCLVLRRQRPEISK
jgi:uncharacterized RDD family membrane protein YckC